jgi:GNAT superfamily N-acetyltransferase
MRRFCERYNAEGDTLDWAEILLLNNHPVCTTSIDVVDNDHDTKIIAYAHWSWGDKDRELKLAKIEVVDESLRGQDIGTVLMKMVIDIAKYYGAPRITGTVAGDSFLWKWYPKLGFTIYDNNKLVMEIDKN